MTARLTLHPAGPRAVLVEFDTDQQVRDYYFEACRRRDNADLPAGIELVPAARTILFDGIEDRNQFAQDVRSWHPQRQEAASHREIEVPVVYDGPDLAVVAEIWQRSIREVIETHSGMVHVVAFLGFAPGFAYIAGLPEPLRVPRRARPRPRVPVGSVAMADQFTGIYPRDSPGGWQLIGRTSVPMWDEAAEPAAYLLPGDHVQFVPVPG
jgi:KipI family sensor histidine kinase inhibitor